MIKLAQMALSVLMVTTVASAFAGQTATNFTVQAVVASSGSLSNVVGPSFGSISTTGTPVAATGSFQVSANTTISPTISFLPGHDRDNPRMESYGGVWLPYNLYLPTGGSLGTPGNYGNSGAACPAAGTGVSMAGQYRTNTYTLGNSGTIFTNLPFNICAQTTITTQPAVTYTDTVSLVLNY